MNTQMGKDGNKFCLHILPNFSLKNSLACLNTKFPKRQKNLWTYTYPNNANAQLDYIFINKKWIDRALNCEKQSFFERVSSNHRIISAKICLNLHRNNKQALKASHYDWFSLTNSDISNKYMVTARNKFDILQEISERHTLNKEYENFVTTHIEATAKCIPTKSM